MPISSLNETKITQQHYGISCTLSSAMCNP